MQVNREEVSGKFAQLKGAIKKRWAKLTDDEVMLYNGRQEQFYGKLKEKYGLAKEEAKEHIEEIEKSCCGPTDKKQ